MKGEETEFGDRRESQSDGFAGLVFFSTSVFFAASAFFASVFTISLLSNSSLSTKSNFSHGGVKNTRVMSFAPLSYSTPSS